MPKKSTARSFELIVATFGFSVFDKIMVYQAVKLSDVFIYSLDNLG